MANTIPHSEAEQLFSDYWDEELGPDAKSRLEEHLASCADCRREYDAFGKMLGGLGALEKQVAPSGFADGVVARLRRRSRGRFFAGALDPRALLRADRVPYEVFSVLMLALLVAIYVVMQLAQEGRLRLPLP